MGPLKQLKTNKIYKGFDPANWGHIFRRKGPIGPGPRPWIGPTDRTHRSDGRTDGSDGSGGWTVRMDRTDRTDRLEDFVLMRSCPGRSAGSRPMLAQKQTHEKRTTHLNARIEMHLTTLKQNASTLYWGREEGWAGSSGVNKC